MVDAVGKAIHLQKMDILASTLMSASGSIRRVDVSSAALTLLVRISVFADQAFAWQKMGEIV